MYMAACRYEIILFLFSFISQWWDIKISAWCDFPYLHRAANSFFHLKNYYYIIILRHHLGRTKPNCGRTLPKTKGWILFPWNSRAVTFLVMCLHFCYLLLLTIKCTTLIPLTCRWGSLTKKYQPRNLPLKWMTLLYNNESFVKGECLVAHLLYSFLGFWFGRQALPACQAKTASNGSYSSSGGPWSFIRKISSIDDCESDALFGVFTRLRVLKNLSNSALETGRENNRHIRRRMLNHLESTAQCHATPPQGLARLQPFLGV